MLTFESTAIGGVANIIEKLTVGLCGPIIRDERSALNNNEQTLPFQKIQHRVDTIDAQPSSEAGGILVLVTGALLVSTIKLG